MKTFRFSVLLALLGACQIHHGLAAPAITATQDDATAATVRKVEGSTITYTTTITNGAPVVVGSTANDATGVQLTNPTPENTTEVAGVSISPVAFDDVYPVNIVPNIGINSAGQSFTVFGNDFLGTPAVTAIASYTQPAHGTVVLQTSGANIGQFTYEPAAGYTGADSFTYTLTNAVGSSVGTVNLNVTGPVVWFANPSAAAGGTGTLTAPFQTLAAANTAANASGRRIFLFAGNYTGGITLTNGVLLYGQGVGGASFDSVVLGMAAPSGTNTRPSINGSDPVITTSVAATNAINLASGGSNTIAGVTIGSTTGSGITSAASFGTLTITDTTINGAGQALALTSGTLAATFDGISSSSGTNGISLTNVGGTLTINSGAINGPTGADFLVNGGTVSITFPGTITNSAGRAVDIQNKTGGTIVFSGAVSDTGTGIFLNNNTGATVTFTGGITSSTGANPAFTATGGGTVTATQNNSTIVNTLTTTSGAALNVANTTIGSAGLTFRSISSNGAPKAIILNNTGAVGGFRVTGNSTAGTGGTIQNNSTRGAEFINVASVSLQRMNFTNANNSVDGGSAGVCDDYTLTGCNSAIYVSGVSGFATFDGLNITGTMVENGITAINVVNFKLDNSLLDGCGNEANESCVEAQNLSGTATVNNTIIQFSETDALAIVNNDVSLNLTINGSTFQDSQTQSSGGPANTNGEGGFQFRSFSRAMLVNGVASTGGFVPVTTINVINSNFLRLATQGIQVFSSDDSVLNLDVTGCNVDSGTGTGTGLDLNADVASIYSFNVLNNPKIRSRGGAAVNITSFRSGHIEGRVNNNPDIQVLSGPGIPVRMVAQETSQLIVQVDNNTVSNVNGTEDTMIDVQSRFQTARADVTITRNTVTGEPTGVAGINIISGSSTAGESNITCADVGGTGLGNNVTNATGNTLRGFRVRNSDLSNTNRLYLEGFTTDTATTWINRGNQPASSAEVAVSVTGTGVLPSGPPGGVCQAVDTPSDFLLAGEGGVEAAKPAAPSQVSADATTPAAVADSALPFVASTPVMAAADASARRSGLSQHELDRVVADAIAAWTASGLTDEQLAVLHALKFEVADLPGQHLGEAHRGRIRVDRDGGGSSWFVEGGSSDEAAFGNEVSATRRYTDPAAAPAGRMDLFTAILHEMGHALGLSDTYAGGDRDKLMYGFLTKGERRLPAKGEAVGIAADADSTRAHFLSAPVSIGTLPPGKSVKVVYSVTVGPLSGNPQQVSSQATISGSNFSSVQTSDAVAGSGATITLLGVPPTFTSANAATFQTGVAGSFTAAANGAPAPTFSVNGTLPSGVTFSPAGVLSGTPAAGTGGTYPITIRASNSINGNPAVADQSFTLTVNQPPAITSASNVTWTRGTPSTFTVTTTGFPKPAITQPSTLPAGVTFVDNGNGTATLSGTPGSNTGGPYSFTITAANGVPADATQSFTLRIITSHANYMAQYGLTGADAAFGADPERDGILNGMEYALSLDPTANSQAGLPVVVIKDYSGTKYLSMTFNRSAIATDLTYTVEGSSDLMNWTALASSTAGGAMNGAGFVSETPSGNTFNVEVRDTTPANANAPMRVLRLKVTSP